MTAPTFDQLLAEAAQEADRRVAAGVETTSHRKES